MRLNIFKLIILACLLNACATNEKHAISEQAEPETEARINDFPTQDRVEFFLECVAQHGGEFRYEVVYPCICSVDKLASKITYQEYTEAKTFTYLRSTPGEKGGIFRDPPQAKQLRKQLKDAKQFAEQSCFVKM